MRRLLGIFVVLVALTGCGESGVLDFFESGFADDTGDNGGNGGNGGGNGDLTAEALVGNWDLNRQASTIVLQGAWDSLTVDANFLSGIISNAEDIATLVISERTCIFRNSSGGNIGEPLVFEIPVDNQIRFTSVNPQRTIRFALNDEGTGLTLTDGTSRAVFEIDENTPVIATYTLRITQAPDQFITTITYRDDDQEDTIIEDFTIVADSDTIRLTKANSLSINVEATLTDNNNILKLIFPPGESRGTAVFDKQ